MPTPDDWVYVNNFKNARQPLALRFPAGTGPKFQSALHHAWQTILKQLERRFTAETYHNRIEQIRQETGKEQQDALVELTKEGEELDLKLISRNEEHCFVPVQYKDDQVHEMTQNDIEALSSKERAEIASNIRYMDKSLSV